MLQSNNSKHESLSNLTFIPRPPVHINGENKALNTLNSDERMFINSNHGSNNCNNNNWDINHVKIM